ncbi:hypothetical protein APY04_2549 [Hyphomicrobium sulfonivorans]|uniref:Uncharacterized protein n=1 Tax=Hyphomicrobium sulfonivorans TaxID=121290 RepID=A0A109BCN1_HYPSL|nr:hypothetical protein APY04_2549 [Hyphomicrobium sulfonivorans]
MVTYVAQYCASSVTARWCHPIDNLTSGRTADAHHRHASPSGRAGECENGIGLRHAKPVVLAVL